MKQISDTLYIAPQLTADDIRQAKAKGFAAIMNNRPDGEEPGQPSAAENRKVAEGEQLAYGGRVREGARGPRQDLSHAEADPSRPAGEHERRTVARVGGKWETLSEVRA